MDELVLIATSLAKHDMPRRDTSYSNSPSASTREKQHVCLAVRLSTTRRRHFCHLAPAFDNCKWLGGESSVLFVY